MNKEQNKLLLNEYFKPEGKYWYFKTISKYQYLEIFPATSTLENVIQMYVQIRT